MISKPSRHDLYRVLSLPSAWLAMMPVILSFATAAVWVALSGRTDMSVALFLGVIAGGLVDMDNHISGRLRQMLVILPAFALVSIMVQITMAHSVFTVLLMTILAFCMTMLGAVDTRYRTVAFGVLVVALYTLLTARAGLAWYINPLMICVGALLYHVMALLVYAVAPHRPVQMRLVAAYHALGEYSRIKADLFQPDEAANIAAIHERLARQNQTVIAAFNQCRDALFSRVSSSGSLSLRTQRQLRDYFIAQDIHERLTSVHIDYAALSKQLCHSDVIFRIARLIRLQGDACTQRATSLDEEVLFVYPEHLRRAMDGIKSARGYLPQQQSVRLIDRLLDNIEEINCQLARLGKKWRPGPHDSQDWRIAAQHSLNVGEAWHILRRNFSRRSSFFRHAVRMALLTAISSILVEALNLHLGYWILLTAVFVCQPNYTATQSRLIERIIGTILGVLIGSLIPLMEPSLNTSLVIIVFSNILFFYFRACNYRFSTLFITVQVLVGFALIGINTGEAMVPRVIDTLIGAALAWACVMFVWPDWRYQSLRSSAKAALMSCATYLAIMAQQFGGKERDDVTYRSARRRVHESATALTNLVNEQRQHPPKHARHIDAAQADELVQLHYRLLGHLSALGAYRGQITDWLSPAYDTDREACMVVETAMMDIANGQQIISDGDTAWQKQFAALNGSQKDDVLAEQLQAISILLAQYSALFQRAT
ncbi:TIGR01666 family membrane protein [Cardiobacteriaceae bacterium TAE3-ERU3]|nr:TIGR01666 family membrane protein [Cardiobacteriaceae bacterium TAE3-ERU3]